MRLSEAADSAADPITRRLAVTNLVYILGRTGRFDEALVPAARAAAAVTEPGRGRRRRGKDAPRHGRDGRRSGGPGPYPEPGARRRRHGIRAARGGGHPRRSTGVARPVRRGGRRRAGRRADPPACSRPMSGNWCAGCCRPNGPRPRSPHRSVPRISSPCWAGSCVSPPLWPTSCSTAAWTRFPERLEPLAAAARVAPRLPLARALVWSARLRQRGLAASCPLVAIGHDSSVDPVVRVRAAAALHGSFHDARAVEHGPGRARRAGP